MNHHSIRSRRGHKMEEVICDKLNITQTASRGRNACPYDGVDNQGRKVEIKTIGVHPSNGYPQAGRMAEKKGLCERLVMEYNGRLFDTASHSDPEYAISQLLSRRVAQFNPGLKLNNKTTQLNINTQVLLECEIAETV